MFKWLILGLFGLSALWMGSMGAGTDMAYVWPGLLVLGGMGCAMVFARSEKCRIPDIWCLVIFALFVGYILARAIDSPVAYSSRSDICLLFASSLVYLLFACFTTSSGSRTFAIWILILVALGNIAIALYQFAGDAGFHIRPNESRVNRVLGVMPSGFYFTHDHMAGFLEVVAIMALSMGVMSSYGSIFRKFYIIAGLLCLVGVAISMSRGGGLSSAAGLITLGLVIIRRARLNCSGLSRGLIAAMTITLAVFLTVSSVMIAKRFRHSKDAKVLNLKDDIRFTNWKLAVKQWEMAPVFGLGSRMYDPYSVKLWPYEVSRVSGHPVFAHNDYLQLLAEYGVIGLGLGILLFGFLFGRGLRNWEGDSSGFLNTSAALRAGALGVLAAYGVHSFFDFNLHIVSNAIPIALCFAILSDRNRSLCTRKGKVIVWVTKIAALAMGSWLLATGVKVTRAEYHRVKMAHSMEAGDNMTGIFHGRIATRLDPDNYLSYRFLGFARLRESEEYEIAALRHSFVSKALDAFELCVEVNPWDIIAQTGIGRCFSKLGESAKAVQAFEAALELGPYEFDTNLYLAYHYEDDGTRLLEKGDVDAGLAILEKALLAYKGAAKADYSKIRPVSIENDNYMAFLRFMADLYCSRASYHEAIGDAASEVGRTEDAKSCYRKSVKFMKKEWDLLLPSVLPETTRRAARLKAYLPQAEK